MPAALADDKDLLGDGDLDDLEGGGEEESHGRFLEGDDEDVEVGAKVAEAVEVLTHSGDDGFVGGGGCEFGGHADLREQDG